MDTEKCDLQRCFITVNEDGFAPSKLAVKENATIVWKNLSERILDLRIVSADGLSSPPLLKPGETYTLTQEHPDTVRFFDAMSDISGEVIVEPHTQESPIRRIKIDFTDPSTGLDGISLIHGKISTVEILPELRKLMINVDMDELHNIGMLRIKLDRALIDAKAFGEDIQFKLLADGKSITYWEVATDKDRTLRIPIPSNTKTVQIVGTTSSAEFLGYDEAKRSLEEAARIVDSYRVNGITSDADDLLLQSKNMFENAKYASATKLAIDAIDTVHDANRVASITDNTMQEAETSINISKSLGINVSDAEEILTQTKEKYSSGEYDEALSMAVQAKMAAASRIDPFILIALICIPSAIGLFIYYKKIHPKAIHREAPAQLAIVQQNTSTTITIADPPRTDILLGLEERLSEKPYIRDDDKRALKYVLEKGGEAFLADIRRELELPKSSSWRLVKRLEREEFVEIVKLGNQNLIKYKI
ncbi:MAG: hypothetical protein DA330_02290 [Nitrososphaera sp.]|nr:hypothetical protein [Nitrososphaera sp.]